MPQNAQAVYSTQPGGLYTMKNIAAATVVKPSLGVIYKVICVTVPSAGNLVVNDLAATTGSAAANIILSVPFGNIVAGQIFSIEASTTTGIAITSVGTGGVFTATYS